MNRFRVVGFLQPSNTGKSYKVFVEVNGQQRFIGLVSRDALYRSLCARPMLVVEISQFVDRPSESFKPIEQRILNGVVPLANSEKAQRG